MSFPQELAAAQRCLDELLRQLELMGREVGDVLEMRRVRTDARRLREDLGLLAESAPPPRAAVTPQQMVTISDAPYKSALWTDLDDEGLGVRDHRAP